MKASLLSKYSKTNTQIIPTHPPQSFRAIHGGGTNAKNIFRNNTNTFNRIRFIIKKIRKETYDGPLKTHQRIVDLLMKDYNFGARGFLIYHQMGVGKTITALATALSFKDDRKAIILVAKSLQENFRSQIAKFLDLSKYEGDVNEVIERHFTFITSNSAKMAAQFASKINTADDNIEDKFSTVAHINLSNHLLIVDEAHNLFRMISNGSKNAMELYDAIKRAKNLKILFLTGTPIANDPFELALCFNMLDYNDGVPLFPEDYQDFEKFFVGKDGIKNLAKFQNRIVGLVSYAEIDDELLCLFPKKEEVKIVRVKMSSDQYLRYALAREKEIDEGKRFFGKEAKMIAGVKPKSLASSTYRVRTRQLSNYSPPENITSIADLRAANININSPKFDAIAKLLKNDGLALVYSQFVELGGLESFAIYLNQHGFHEYSSKSHLSNSQEDDAQGAPKAQGTAYTFITGKVEFTTRAKNIEVLNSKENIDGKLIKLILVSSTGAEGLDLKNIRNIFIMEPYWNYGRIEQIQARGVRLNSHEALTEDKRNVNTYIFLSIQPDEATKTEETTDEELYKKSVFNKLQINSFLDAIKGASIECEFYKSTQCKACQPTNKRLFDPNIYRDMKLSDPCQKSKETSVDVREIIIDDQKFFYSPNQSELYDYAIYTYDPSLGAYLKMRDDNDKIVFVIDEIKKINHKIKSD
ncbi:MAG: DEAD/DEAH box helicase family protein [Candidatus Aenigmarchaeota archaeon]|nr:DEAD/DEAH box helicase family protein [Candidatus Aenigmarchaeota archaeon]